MKAFAFCLALVLSNQTYAQVAPFTYRLRGLHVREDAHTMSIDAPSPVSVRIVPGGGTWPPVALDENGNVHVGDRVVTPQSSSGTPSFRASSTDERSLVLPHGYRVTALEKSFRIVRGRTVCTLLPTVLGLVKWRQPLEAMKHNNIVFRASDTKLLALTTWLGAEKSDTRYAIADIDMATCRVHRATLGNPDLLVELNWSPGGGWWVTGSIEQTLLRSSDGRHWHPAVLPESLSSLVSAYVVDEREYWLAGILPGFEDDDPLIVHSSDGGRSWKSLRRGDPAFERMPKGWLEGWRRLGSLTAE
jgi:hypothetical protein